MSVHHAAAPALRAILTFSLFFLSYPVFSQECPGEEVKKYSETILKDENADGEMDQIIFLFFDDLGNVIKKEIDDDGDGAPNFIAFYYYDNNNNKIREEKDEDGDGIVNRVITLEYDSTGNLLKEEHDGDANGSPDRIHEFIYDENYNLIEDNTDSDADGIIDRATKTVFDSKNNPILIEEFSKGIPYRREFNTYDIVGNLIKSEFDQGADGVIDDIYLYTYDEKNLLIKKETFSIRDSIVYFSYDDRGNLIEENHDHGADGQIDAILRYTFDEQNNLTHQTRDDNADGQPEWIQYLTYDTKGNLIRLEDDFQGDGFWDLVIYFRYDGNGNKIRMEIWAFIFGNVSFQNWAYDEYGNLIREELDHNGDGVLDSITHHQITYCTLPSGNSTNAPENADGGPGGCSFNGNPDGKFGNSGIGLFVVYFLILMFFTRNYHRA